MNFERIKQILKPSLVQLGLYILISIIIFVVSGFGAITDKIKDQARYDQPIVRSALDSNLAEINNIPYLNIVTIVIFWSMIGLVIYTVFWLGITILTQARNEIVVETDYVNRGSLTDRIKIPLIQIGIFMLLLIIVIISLSVTYPTWIQFFNQFLISLPDDWLNGLMYLGFGLFGSVLNLYVIRILIKFMFNVDHIIEK